jgi:hypothetical protein
MGFLDKLKGTAKQALNPVGQAGERGKIMRINEAGVETPATVDSMQEVGTQLGPCPSACRESPSLPPFTSELPPPGRSGGPAVGPRES